MVCKTSALCILVLCILSSLGLSIAASPSEHFRQFVTAYSDDKTDLSRLHPIEFNELYLKVKNHFSRDELRTIMSKQAGIQLDEFHMKRILFVASPDSVRVQSQQHVDWVPKLVNDETLVKGVTFFKQHNATLEKMEKWLEGLEPVVVHQDLKVPYRYSMGATTSRFFIEIRDNQRIMGIRCPRCNVVFVPPRTTCARCFSQLHDWV